MAKQKPEDPSSDAFAGTMSGPTGPAGPPGPEGPPGPAGRDGAGGGKPERKRRKGQIDAEGVYDFLAARGIDLDADQFVAYAKRHGCKVSAEPISS